MCQGQSEGDSELTVVPREGRGERAGFSRLSFYLEVVNLPPPSSPPPSSRASVTGKVAAQFGRSGQGSLPVSDVLSCVCSLSTFNVQGQKALSVGDLSGGGQTRRNRTSHFLSSQGQASSLSRCLRIWSHITNHLCEYPKIWALNSLPSEGYPEGHLRT